MILLLILSFSIYLNSHYQIQFVSSFKLQTDNSIFVNAQMHIHVEECIFDLIIIKIFHTFQLPNWLK